MVITEPAAPIDIDWATDSPMYRVYFWLPGAGCERRLPGGPDWGQAEGDEGRTFTLYVEHTEATRPGLIRLAGVDPTEVDQRGRPLRTSPVNARTCAIRASAHDNASLRRVRLGGRPSHDYPVLQSGRPSPGLTPLAPAGAHRGRFPVIDMH